VQTGSCMIVDARISISGLFKAGLLVVAANIVFFLLVFLVNASLDHHKIFDRLASAAAAGVINDQDNPADLATYADRYTDCVAMGLNLRDSPDRTALQMMRDSEIAVIEGR
jgi:hypothetical protein